MVLPLDRGRLSAKNRSDDADDIADALLRSPGERIELALALSDVAEDLRAHGAAETSEEAEPRRRACLCQIIERR
jgi:hypothetical protein